MRGEVKRLFIAAALFSELIGAQDVSAPTLKPPPSITVEAKSKKPFHSTSKHMNNILFGTVFLVGIGGRILTRNK